MRATLVLLALALNAFAESPIILGARGGASFTNNSLTSSFGFSNPAQQFTIGPTFGVRLPLGFSVEGDALYNRQTLDIGQFAGITAGSIHANSWEFPMMLKFAPGHSVIAPVFGAGLSVRHISNPGNGLSLGMLPSYLLNGTTNSNTLGFVAGAGLQFKTGAVRITPEVRYTRWNSGGGLAQSLIDLIAPNRNQAQVLVGLTF